MKFIYLFLYFKNIFENLIFFIFLIQINIFLIQINIFLIFSDDFDMLILKIIF
jgi:hypothetical protein